MIKRLTGTAPGRSRTVVHNGLAYTVTTARDKSESMHAQTVGALAQLDAQLAEVGSHKSKLLSVRVYIADMARKSEMNDAWLAWVDPDNAPQRACLGVVLDGRDLVEIVAIAAI